MAPARSQLRTASGPPAATAGPSGRWRAGDGEAGAADEADSKIAQDSDGTGASPDGATDFEEGHVADIVQPVLDGPVVSDELEQPLRCGVVSRQNGDEIGDLDTFPAPDPVAALDAVDLGQAQPGEIGNDLLAVPPSRQQPSPAVH
jgi:hypothetical protein